MLSIIIPTFNSAATLGKAIKSMRKNDMDVFDTMVVDGGSDDLSATIGASLGASVFTTQPGRGRQLAFGADKAIENGATWLLFVHGDSVLPDGVTEIITDFINNPKNINRAGYFKLSFSDDSADATRVSGLANWRAETFGLPYGDQGFLISASFYKKLGGFKSELDLMEDVDMAMRVGKKNFVQLDGEIETSAEKYVRDGWVLRPLKNILCLLLYLGGAGQKTIKGIYK